MPRDNPVIRHPAAREDAPERKPLKLKTVLQRYFIPQAEWARAIKQNGGQSKGQGFSRACATQILRYNTWPRLTSAESIMAQTEAFLRDRGVPEGEIATIWDYEDGTLTYRSPVNPTSHANEFDKELPENDMLNHKAKKHFKLFQDPFTDDVQSSEDVFVSDEQRYIRESMFYVAKHGGFLAVVGESGSGKTTLRRDLLDRIGREHESISVIQPRIIDKQRLTAGGICAAIIEDISTERPKHSLEAKGRQIERLLTGASRAGNHHVLMIEEAHDLTVPTLKYLKRFWELEDGFKKLLAIILIGQPELKQKLDLRINWEAREVINRCEVAELQPLNGELEDYLALKLRRVGKEIDDVFDRDAFDAIRERLTLKRRATNQAVSMHYPLIVNNTVVKCMNLAAEIGAPKINADLVQGV